MSTMLPFLFTLFPFFSETPIIELRLPAAEKNGSIFFGYELIFDDNKEDEYDDNKVSPKFQQQILFHALLEQDSLFLLAAIFYTSAQNSRPYPTGPPTV